ncbi:MAG: hypothetical protein ACTHN5_20995 [Phycisphaerae bacterium]
MPRFTRRTILPFLLAASLAAATRAAEITLERTDGPVTRAEIASFKAFTKTVPVPTSNHHNGLVYGSGGGLAEALGTVYEITHDREILDQLVTVSDKILAARNNPDTGRILWTGKRDLVWPNKAENANDAKYSGTENGDVLGHMLYAAQLILQDKSLWSQSPEGDDPYSFGKTYLDRAKTYVREADRTTDNFIIPYFVQTGTNRYYFPRSDAFVQASGWTSGDHDRPIPWNQQMMLNNGMMRVAICHELLGDAPNRVKQCDAIVKASCDWFLQSAVPVTVDGHECRKWTYAVENPMKHIEDAGHGGYDMLIYRAYASGRYGITADQLLPFANTVQYIMYQGKGMFATRVDGKSKTTAKNSIGATWMYLSAFSPTLYPLIKDADFDQSKSRPLTAALIMWARTIQANNGSLRPKDQTANQTN